MKKLFLLFLSLTLVVSFAACGGSSGTAPASSAAPAGESSPADDGAGSAEGGRVFGYTAMDLTNPFHIAMRDKIATELEARGDRLIAVDGALDQTKQNNAIEDMITQGISALFLNPVDSKGVLPALEACAAENIPVINVDSAVEALDLVETFISSNNVQAGKLCGEELVRLYPDGAKICVIENPLAESVVERVNGLESALEGSGIEIVGRKSISSPTEILTASEDLAQAHPDMDAFWGLNDDVSLTILGVIESSGMADTVRVFSVDGSPSAKKSIAAGGMYATAAQSPVSMAAKAVECAYTLLEGGSIEPTYSIDTTLVTPDNVESVGTDAWA